MYNNISFSRSNPFNKNGDQVTVSFIKLDEKKTDKLVVWKSGQSKMPKVSFDYYSGNPTYGWLIMLANPEWTMEYDIPNNTIIRIPYPLQDSLNEYRQKANDFAKNF